MPLPFFAGGGVLKGCSFRRSSSVMPGIPLVGRGPPRTGRKSGRSSRRRVSGPTLDAGEAAPAMGRTATLVSQPAKLKSKGDAGWAETRNPANSRGFSTGSAKARRSAGLTAMVTERRHQLAAAAGAARGGSRSGGRRPSRAGARAGAAAGGVLILVLLVIAARAIVGIAGDVELARRAGPGHRARHAAAADAAESTAARPAFRRAPWRRPCPAPRARSRTPCPR